MLRADIEKFMKENKMDNITLMYDENSRLGTYCFISSGYLVDYTAHRVDRKKDIFGWVKWDDKGNADVIRFSDNSVVRPFARERKIVR